MIKQFHISEPYIVKFDLYLFIKFYPSVQRKATHTVRYSLLLSYVDSPPSHSWSPTCVSAIEVRSASRQALQRSYQQRLPTMQVASGACEWGHAWEMGDREWSHHPWIGKRGITIPEAVSTAIAINLRAYSVPLDCLSLLHMLKGGRSACACLQKQVEVCILLLPYKIWHSFP